MTSKGHTMREPAGDLADTCWTQSSLKTRWGQAAVWVQKNGSRSWEVGRACTHWDTYHTP